MQVKVKSDSTQFWIELVLEIFVVFLVFYLRFTLIIVSDIHLVVVMLLLFIR